MVTFTVTTSSALSPEQIVDEIFNITNWSGFAGWGPIPGIAQARMIERTDTRVGTRIVVTNTDGSTHQESVVEYEPDRHLVMRIDGFSAPLNRLAEYFLETWRFERRGQRTFVQRRFDLYPRGPISNVFLKLLGVALRRAVQAHTRTIAIE